MREVEKPYQKADEKSSKKISKKAAKANASKQQRIQAARTSVAIPRLLAHLSLQTSSGTHCPYCKQPSLATTEDHRFHCANCKQSGDTVKLTKQSLNLSYWGAVHELERLAEEQKAPPTPPKQKQPQNNNRYSANDIEQLKREIDLADLVRSSGVPLKKQGKNLVGRCPFHDDKTPSLVITPAKNLWHCLGACQKGGSVIDWVMQQQRVEFRQAVQLLKDDFPHLAVRLAPLPIPQPETTHEPHPAQNGQLLNRVVDHYHSTLKNDRAAQDYLAKRGIDNREAISKFQLGFANRSLSQQLPAGEKGKRLRAQLTELGVYRENGREHLRGSLVVPIFDERNNASELYGRKISDRLRKGTPKHLYLPGPHKGIFNRDCLAEKQVILCESLLDALSFWAHGHRNVTSSYGTNGFTQEHLAAFQAHGVEQVLIAYDNDQAGNEAAAKLKDRLTAVGIACLRVVLPTGYDVNDVVTQNKDLAAKKLRELLENAQPLGQNATQLAVEEAAKRKKASTNHEIPSLVAAIPPVPQIAQSKNQQSKATSEIPSLAAKKQEATNREIAPPSPLTPVTATKKGEDIEIVLGERLYRIRGLQKNLSFDVIRVNIRASIADRYHIDTFDLYHARNRTNFIRMSATELGINQEVIKRDVGKIILKLEEMQQQLVKETLEEKPKPTLSKEERTAAIALLRTPQLIQRITSDIKRCGLVGEELNALMVYIAGTSRLLDDPLGLIIQALSAAGKSSVLELILSMFPDSDKVKYSAMTSQSLFYMGEKDLKHKILAISEEEGAEKASYALKILQSEKGLTMASTGKDPKTGRHKTNEYRTEGPVQPMMTTTSEEIDEELQNRFFVLTPDERREQTKAIHELQRTRETLSGMLAKEDKECIIKLHQHAQQMLRPLMVVNPYAEKLTFLDATLRTRRDHVKYLTLIRAIALLHQYQRPVKRVKHNGKLIEYIEVIPEDIIVANRLANHILGTSLDEMAPQTRKMLNLVWQMVKEANKGDDCVEYRFTQRQVREYTHWGHTQTKIHLARLVDMEYLLVHRGKRGMSYEYELLYKGEGKDGSRFLVGLLDPKQLQNNLVSTTMTRGGRG